jgi:phosphoglucosamine mutase
MTEKAYFGTDGIRGRVGEAPITPDFVLKLGWACGRVFSRGSAGGRCSVIIGKDTRVSGYMFESALEAGLVAAGVDVKLLGPMPTPAVALMTRTQNADAGIVISASHNPYYDNGIKFFSAEGANCPTRRSWLSRRSWTQPLQTVQSHDIGKVSGSSMPRGATSSSASRRCPRASACGDCALPWIARTAPPTTSRRAYSANSAPRCFPSASRPDGFNINDGVGSTDMAALAATVREQRADLGIAYDGDGDRVLFVDDQGSVVDGDQLLYVIAMQRLVSGRSDAGVVGTLMSNLGLEIALREQGLQFVRARVGDRYVRELMETQAWKLGGESSGHIICSDVTTTGDGIVASLQVLLALGDMQRSLRDIVADMPLYPQHMINVRVAPGAGLSDSPAITAAIAAVEKELGDAGRVLLRPSGTEPVIRVMVEGRDAEQVRRLCERLAGQVESSLQAA